MTDPETPLTLAVPAYFHPADAPKQWNDLVSLARSTRFVIVNVHNGPGEELDPPYLDVTKALRATGVRMLGYVDTDYGRREPTVVAQEASAYRARYGLDGIFMDQVSSGLDQLDHYAQCVVAARTAGAHFVALNAGAEPHPGYVDLANITVTFEGTWSAYKSLRVSDWVHRYPAKRFCHLVHSMPRGSFAHGLEMAARRNVGSVFLTDGRGANPWDHIPPRLITELRKTLAEDDARWVA